VREPVFLDRVDSTNEECKRRARAGATDGLTVVAREQTGGKGRRGRSFQSLAGKGLYLSTLLYPEAPPEDWSQLTAWAAVAVSRAIERLAGLTPGIKWPNDLIVEGKKLCGILTEGGAVLGKQYVILGIGVNLTQTAADFGPDLAPIATSLAQQGRAVTAEALARAILDELEALRHDFPHNSAPWLEEYRRRCITLGRPVKLSGPEGESLATALDVNGDFTLLVREEGGRVKTVSSGEVSVRGLLGYT